MSRLRKILYGLLTVSIILGLVEAGLRLFGFRHARVTTDLEFNYPQPRLLRDFFEPDPELLYRIRRSETQPFVTWDPRLKLMLRGDRPVAAKAPGVLRVVALGDSSTYGVNTGTPWPALLEPRLRASRKGPVEVVNLGVPGYTVFQGRRLLETRGASLEADVMVFYFGWNDHLLALGGTDAELRHAAFGGGTFMNWFYGSRIVQAVAWAVARTRSAMPNETSPLDATGQPARRVGLEAYGKELRRVVRMSRDFEARPVLCTYPTALRALAASGRIPGLLPTHVIDGTVQDLVTIQQQYNDTVRTVARETGAALLDLAASFAASPDGLFAGPGGDFIHPVDPGYNRIADEAAKLLSSWH